MTPRFSEMNKVRVNDRENEPYEGYVIDSQFRDGRWLYKLSISEDPANRRHTTIGCQKIGLN
jgi:hypothetical protein